MNSRWQANKIGLLNFWYYDEQEFPFVKGRMLLRGSNGSGKSVTMQSVVPLLLDGNMSPERLDPFGSRDRKMSSYLLEEDDDREERLGYLYLEFKRAETDAFLTIGMGIRARRGKPLDKWYFGIHDGRRIGEDLKLYKETGEKVPLTKRELENRILPGGLVFDRQADYMDYVNRMIFGFETAEEYKEMIDLLIQLRTPKLSRDFKPTVINEILSDSLQPLSDEDLRPMSEAIENMDSMNMNLKARKAAKNAADKIQKELEQYNRWMLYAKASLYEESQKKLDQEKKDRDSLKKELEKTRIRLEKTKEELEELDAKKLAMEKEKDSLDQSDALALKRRQAELEQTKQEEEEKRKEKDNSLQQKKDRRLSLEEKGRELKEREEAKEEELKEKLEEMQEKAEDFAFDEDSFLQAHFSEDLQSAYDWKAHEQILEGTMQQIREGRSVLERVDRMQRDVDHLMLDREKQQKEGDRIQKKQLELDQLMAQTINEWQEALYLWQSRNTELLLKEEQLHGIAEQVGNYDEQFDFSNVRSIAADERFRKQGLLQEEDAKLSLLQQQAEAERKQLEEEKVLLEQQREVEPDRSEAVKENRRRLKEKGIPFSELYKVLEFSDQLEDTACDRLEEAMLEMGILDALVIENEYKEQVLSFDPDVTDRYLFAGKYVPGQSLLDLLDLNEESNDLFFNQKMAGILGSIAFDQEGYAWIRKDGTWKNGVLHGTVSGNHKAGFIGTKARERNRQERIRLCQEAILKMDRTLSDLLAKRQVLKERQKMLVQEYALFPGDEDLKVSFRLLQDCLLDLERCRGQIRKLEETIQERNKEIREDAAKAVKLSDRLGLACRLNVFLEAESASFSYEKLYVSLTAGHELYLQILSQERELEEQIADTDLDLDQLLYDRNGILRALRKAEEELASIDAQLSLSDYQEIKERLDSCISWLNAWPGRLSSLIEQQTKDKEQLTRLREQLETAAGNILKEEDRCGYLREGFQQELHLDYVPEAESCGEDRKQLLRLLAPVCEALDRDELTARLNKAFFENRGALNEYHLLQTELFAGEPSNPSWPKQKRMDIQARWQGLKVSFGSLLQHLEEDIRELEGLIRDGDRELFEDILANTVSRKIRSRIYSSTGWVEKMNSLMNAMNTSSGLRLNLRWRARSAETEDQLDTKDLVELLKKDYRLMREDEAARLSQHFRSKVEQARRSAGDSGAGLSFYQVMKETLDYRKWFEFQLFSQKAGERQKELTNSVFGTFSGGEKAMAMYVPLFSAVAAKYQGGRKDAPRLISLDEAFAGVDNRNIRDMFRLMTEFGFDFIINSQVLWGDYDTLDALAIYQLIRPENAKFVTVMSYLWNGNRREMLDSEQQLEERAAELS